MMSDPKAGCDRSQEVEPRLKQQHRENETARLVGRAVMLSLSKSSGPGSRRRKQPELRLHFLNRLPEPHGQGSFLPTCFEFLLAVNDPDAPLHLRLRGEPKLYSDAAATANRYLQTTV
jgi:hypothetical protein